MTYNRADFSSRSITVTKFNKRIKFSARSPDLTKLKVNFKINRTLQVLPTGKLKCFQRRLASSYERTSRSFKTARKIKDNRLRERRRRGWCGRRINYNFRSALWLSRRKDAYSRECTDLLESCPGKNTAGSFRCKVVCSANKDMDKVYEEYILNK